MSLPLCFPFTQAESQPTRLQPGTNNARTRGGGLYSVTDRVQRGRAGWTLLLLLPDTFEGSGGPGTQEEPPGRRWQGEPRAMLLPSDVARLVLGYLQQEKLITTCRAFIEESPNLKEYAEYFSSDGLIPGCILSSMGKNLTTILNEYVALKTREKKDDVPLMMSSLWKKLDHTLSQIRSLQESKSFHTFQRARTRYGIENIRHQRTLPLPASTPQPAAQQTSTPIVAAQVIARPCNTKIAPHARPLFDEQSTIQGAPSPVTVSNESSFQVSSLGTSEKKSSSAVSSPMKRKTDSQKRRRIPVPSTSRTTQEGETEEGSDPLQEIIDDNFPQLVIENAREKILSNKSLQEKLAENINKFLGSDSSAPHNVRPVDGGTVEQDTSIDEILGLQGGEIHMSEEAIHDILAQTETDPDFQELYDLFAYPTSQSSNQADARSNQKNHENSPIRPSLQKDHRAESSRENTTAPLSHDRLGQPGGKQKTDPSCAADRTGEDTVVEAGKSSQEAVSEPYCLHSSDVEVDTVSQTDEVPVSSTHIAERDLSSSSDLDNHPEQASKSLESSMEVTTDTVTAKVHSNDDTREREGPTQQRKPVSKVRPGLKSVAAQKENNEQDVTATPTYLAVADGTEKPVHELKPPQSSAMISNTIHPKLPSSETQIAIPLVQIPSSGGSLYSKPASGSTVGSTSSDNILDPSQIVTLNIITEDVASEVELSNAVTAIVGEHLQSIIMSPVVIPQNCRVESSADEVDFSSSGNDKHALPQLADLSSNAVGIQVEDSPVYQAVGASNPNGDTGLIQLVPATGSTHGPSNSILISTCGPQSTANPSNVMLIPNNTPLSGNQQKACVLQTPPRHDSRYAMGQTISSKLPQGSTIILASPVQPMLQGVVGMFPLSVVGGNPFAASSHQVVRIPVCSNGIPKLQLPPKSQKPIGVRSMTIKGKQMPKQAMDPVSRPSTSSVQRVKVTEQNNSSKLQIIKFDECSVPQSTSKGAESHRRVLCFDTIRKPVKSSAPSTPSTPANSSPQNKDQSDIMHTATEVGVSTPAVQCLPTDAKRPEQNDAAMIANATSDTEIQASAASSSSNDQTVVERRTAVGSSTDGPCVVTANKENVHGMESEKQKLKDLSKVNTIGARSEKNTQPGQDDGRRVNSNIKKTPQKRTNSTSTLTKRPGDSSPEIQFQSPNTKQFCDELPIPRTPGSGVDDPLLDDCDSTRTPTCKRYDHDGGTPRPMQPPATPDFPKCSPASETGSESSVSIAAHTLMILSRASMTKSGSNTPLKDNTQLAKTFKSSSKKRKLEEPDDRPPRRTEHHIPSSTLKKKKVKKHRRRSLDSFPSGIDVDKFLMSLHYDE